MPFVTSGESTKSRQTNTSTGGWSMNAKQRKALITLVQRTHKSLAHELHVAMTQKRVKIHEKFEERMGYVALSKEINKLTRQANKAVSKIRGLIPEGSNGRTYWPNSEEIAPSALYGRVPPEEPEYQELKGHELVHDKKIDALSDSTARAEFAIEMSGSEATIAKLIDSLDIELKGYLEAHFRGIIDA